MNAATLRAIADALEAQARAMRAMADDSTTGPTSMLPIAGAAERAGCSVRTIRTAIKLGDLAAFGKQRDRAVRADDLAAWIESRKVRVTEGHDDLDMDRRVARLARGSK